MASRALPLLAGDVGGTNTRLALLSPDGKRVVRQEFLKSHQHTTLESAVKKFLGGQRVRAASLAVAGPVVDGKCTATNLPWVISERSLEKKCSIGRVMLLNDLVAAAYGAMHTPSSKLAPLWGDRLPKRKGGNVAILAPGTGLGEAALIWDGTRHVPLASEGGHGDFAPRNELETRLLAFMRRRLQRRVSFERVLSGPAFGHLYDFFVESERVKETKANKHALAAASDRNAAISELAIAKKSRAAEKALALFISLLGSEVGNLALRTLPIGGIYVAGGIAARLVNEIRKGAFVSSFLDKGRMETLLRSMSVAVVLDGEVGLKGSSRVAASLVK